MFKHLFPKDLDPQIVGFSKLFFSQFFKDEKRAEGFAFAVLIAVYLLAFGGMLGTIIWGLPSLMKGLHAAQLIIIVVSVVPTVTALLDSILIKKLGGKK